MDKSQAVVDALHDTNRCYAACGRTLQECEPKGLSFQKDGTELWVCPQCWHSGAAWDMWVREAHDMRYWHTTVGAFVRDNTTWQWSAPENWRL